MADEPNAYQKTMDLVNGIDICHVRFSKQVDKIIPAMVKARKNFHPIHLDGKVSVRTKGGAAFSFKYATLPEIISSVDDALLAEGVFFTQHPRVAERCVVVSTIIMHESGQYMASEYAVPIANPSDPKEIGSATSYARRYSIGPILGVVAEEDTDAATSFDGQVEHEQRHQPRPNAQPQVQRSEVKPAPEREHWADLLSQLAKAGINLDERGQIVNLDKPLARELVLYCTNNKVTTEAAYRDPVLCKEAVEALARGNADWPADSEDPLIKHAQEKLLEKAAP